MRLLSPVDIMLQDKSRHSSAGLTWQQTLCSVLLWVRVRVF